MVHFIENQKESKSSQTISIAVGDHVALYDIKNTCFVEQIRNIKTGKPINKFKGNFDEIMVRFKGHDFKQDIWMKHLDINKNK